MKLFFKLFLSLALASVSGLTFAQTPVKGTCPADVHAAHKRVQDFHAQHGDRLGKLPEQVAKHEKLYKEHAARTAQINKGNHTPADCAKILKDANAHYDELKKFPMP
jgi:hypothetical protein